MVLGSTGSQRRHAAFERAGGLTQLCLIVCALCTQGVLLDAAVQYPGGPGKHLRRHQPDRRRLRGRPDHLARTSSSHCPSVGPATLLTAAC